MENERVIGKYTGSERGPLLIVVGAMHGNEPAGVRALEIMFKLLEVEPHHNPDFLFCGRIVGLIGNLEAYKHKTRYIERDLNRMWSEENVSRIMDAPGDSLQAEDKELRELLQLIREEVDEYQPDQFIFLDIHTTTAYGGIFTIATDDPESLHLAVELHAPVITGFLRKLKGTSMHYFNNDHFEPHTISVAFEAGQHDEPLSTNRAIAAITNLMRTVGCVKPEHVENRHDELLIEYSKGLPKVAELLRIHSIEPEDHFRMMPDYKNFQPVKKGEVLAHDKEGEVRSPEDGMVLMPLYQKQGDDGFFLIRRVEF